MKPPRRNVKRLHIPLEAAQRLAWYEAQIGPGVLAPRGWLCFTTYGSNGSTIYASPNPFPSKLFFAGKWKGYSGPAIELSDMSGGTSGRFEVAETIGLVFPVYRPFAQAVVDEHLMLDRLPSGPFAGDKLIYHNPHEVEYTTPAGTQGLGTKSWLLKTNDQPISGVQILTGADTDLVSLSIRLPTEALDLASVITREVERENREPPPKP